MGAVDYEWSLLLEYSHTEWCVKSLIGRTLSGDKEKAFNWRHGILVTNVLDMYREVILHNILQP